MAYSPYYTQETISAFEAYMQYFFSRYETLGELNTPEEFAILQTELANTIQHQERFIDTRLKLLMAGISDEFLLQQEWKGQEWWQNNLLEFTLFKTYTAGDQIFIIARNIINKANIANKGLGTVILDAIALGFCGKYSSTDEELIKIKRGLSLWLNDSYSKNYQICPQCSQHTLTSETVRSLPTLRNWYLALGGGSLLMLIISFSLWIWLSKPVTDLLKPLFNN